MENEEKKKIIKIWTKISEIENRKAIGKKTQWNKKIGFWKRINQIEKQLAKLTPKVKGEKIQISEIKNETGDIYSEACGHQNNDKEILWITTHNLDEINQHLEKHKLSEFAQY